MERSLTQAEALKYSTILMDFHGVFTNNKGRLANALNAAYRNAAGRNVTRDEFQAALNRPLKPGSNERISVPDFLEQYINGSMPADIKEALIETYKRQNDAIYVPKHRPTIRRLAALGATLAIVTNGNEAAVAQAVQAWGLDDVIFRVYGKGPNARLEGLKAKPDAAPIEHVIEDLRGSGRIVRRDRTLFVGDYRTDIEAGNGVGLHTAFLVTGPNQRPEDYAARPTYALLDIPQMEVFSEWLRRENTYPFHVLPRIVEGDI